MCDCANTRHCFSGSLPTSRVAQTCGRRRRVADNAGVAGLDSRASWRARGGDHDRAHEILTEVDARYRGDAFEDEPYEEWADGLREETRAAWLRSLRHLAELRARSGEHQDAASLLVRMLVADPYDEPAHHALVDVLVGAGRHGEARRAFDRWVAAMRSIDAPLPNPGVLRPRGAAPPSNSPPATRTSRVAVTATLTRR